MNRHSSLSVSICALLTLAANPSVARDLKAKEPISCVAIRYNEAVQEQVGAYAFTEIENTFNRKIRLLLQSDNLPTKTEDGRPIAVKLHSVSGGFYDPCFKGFSLIVKGNYTLTEEKDKLHGNYLVVKRSGGVISLQDTVVISDVVFWAGQNQYKLALLQSVSQIAEKIYNNFIKRGE